MSFIARLPRAAVAALRTRRRAIAAATLVGAVIGIAWALADRAEYEATATVLAADRGVEAEDAPEGVIAGSAGEAAARAVEVGRGRDVAEGAAILLGRDLSGADLLALTEFSVGDGAIVVIESTATSPDVAAAAADAFAEALVTVVADAEDVQLRRRAGRLEEQLLALDPASDEAVEAQASLDVVEDLRAAPEPLAPGAAATLPREPISERSVSRSALLGALAGAVIAWLAAAAAEARRRPLRSAAEVEEAAGAPPVASLPSAGRIAAGFRVGRRGALLLEPGLADPLRSLAGAIDLDRPGEGPRTVALTSPAHDDGRTAVSLGLAVTLVRLGASVLLVEADLRRPSLAAMLGLSPTPGLAQYLTAGAGPREVMRTVMLGATPAGERDAGLVCVPAGSVAGPPAELLSGSRFRGLVDRLRRAYDVVLFDTPPTNSGSDAAAVAAAVEATLVLARAGTTTAQELSSALRAVGSDRAGRVVLLAG